MKLIRCFILIFTFSSCAFNGMFLHPTKMDVDQHRSIELDKGATIQFDKDTYHPTFQDSLGNRLDLGYEIQSFFIESNHRKLNGWLLKPKQKADITILHFHGNAGFLLSQIKAIDPLVERGFQVFMFDYSGFGFSTGEASRKHVWEDGNAALDYVIKQEIVKNTELIIYGQSLGGHLAAAISSKREEDIDGLVIEGAFSSHSDIAGNRVPILGNVFVREMYSGKKAIKNFEKPVLIIHSNQDKTIPLNQGRSLFKKANEPKHFMVIDKCHICGLSYYPDKIAKRIRAMLKQDLEKVD